MSSSKVSTGTLCTTPKLRLELPAHDVRSTNQLDTRAAVLSADVTVSYTSPTSVPFLGENLVREPCRKTPYKQHPEYRQGSSFCSPRNPTIISVVIPYSGSTLRIASTTRYSSLVSAFHTLQNIVATFTL